ncbi:MAG: acyl carrier protein [Vulcanimicrobiota bacterium]
MSAFAYAKLIWVAQPIEEFVSTLLAQRGRPAPASPEQSLFLSGLLDSMDAMQTILFLEAEFGVDFSRHAFSLELIDSLERMVSLTESTGG